MGINLKEEAKNLAQAAAESGAEQVCELLLEGVVGTVAPGAVSTVLAYRQKRQEKMYLLFLEELRQRMQIVEERLQKLSSHSLLVFREKYFGMISDYALEEVQEEKIAYMVNGLANLAAIEEPKEDFVLQYYDTLLELRLLDLAVLKNFYARSHRAGETYHELLPKLGIDTGQYVMIKEKLTRLGLLETDKGERDEKLYENMLVMQDHLSSLAQGKKLSTGKRFKSVKKRDSYHISKYGRSFIEFFQ